MMADRQVIDITELAALGEQFPLRLMQLGFRLMQVADETGQDQFRYIVPPLCKVPAGPFLMGSDKKRDSYAYDEELPQHTVTLGAFEIGTYPLTVAEYASFVQATNPILPRAWSQQQQHADHPVDAISWHNALAYTQWLTQVTGDLWRLPTEAEWEKAARGCDGRLYPWGDQWDPAQENTIGRRSPVGNNPSGTSPYGVQDMIGIVKEWTSSTYKLYPYRARDGREKPHSKISKVYRGGSADDHGTGANYQRGARATIRWFIHNWDPDISAYYIGMRLVRGGGRRARRLLF